VRRRVRKRRRKSPRRRHRQNNPLPTHLHVYAIYFLSSHPPPCPEKNSSFLAKKSRTSFSSPSPYQFCMHKLKIEFFFSISKYQRYGLQRKFIITMGPALHPPPTRVMKAEGAKKGAPSFMINSNCDLNLP